MKWMIGPAVIPTASGHQHNPGNCGGTCTVKDAHILINSGSLSSLQINPANHLQREAATTFRTNKLMRLQIFNRHRVLLRPVTAGTGTARMD